MALRKCVKDYYNRKRKFADGQALILKIFFLPINILLTITCTLLRSLVLLPVWIYQLFIFCPRKYKNASKKEFLIIGHRGAAAYEVENTIEACLKALQVYQANSLEIDLSFTKDEQVVLWHDWDPDNLVSRVRRAGWEPHVKYKPFYPKEKQLIKKTHLLSYKELSTNYGYSRKFRSKKISGINIPLFDDFVKWAAEQAELKYVLLDIKTPVEQKKLIPIMLKKIKQTFEKYNPSFISVLLSPEKEIIKAMHETNSQGNYSYDVELPFGLLIDPVQFSSVDKAAKMNNTYSSLGRPAIQIGPWTAFRRVVGYDLKRPKFTNGQIKKIIGWTVNRKREMKCLIKMGIPAVLTDKPDKLKQVYDKLSE